MMNARHLFKHHHFSTIYPALFRKVNIRPYLREELTTYDGDFIHIDRLFNQSDKVVILLHGLEGSSEAHYMKSQAKIFTESGYDVIALNFRSCSGVMNKTTTFYHSGEIRDLQTLISYVKDDYKEVSLIGFSLGGNIILNYLGRTECEFIKSAVVFSAPIDLGSAVKKIAKGFGLIYSAHFMTTLREKVEWLKVNHKDSAVATDINTKKLKTFFDFDELVTAPLHGFSSAKDYWVSSSSKPYLSRIKVPTLLVNAKNDPFLGETCYLKKGEVHNDRLLFESPKYGGHIGFTEKSLKSYNFMDKRANSFILGVSNL